MGRFYRDDVRVEGRPGSWQGVVWITMVLPVPVEHALDIVKKRDIIAIRGIKE